MMFDGITEAQVLGMTAQQNRWLDNIKKAFHESDRAMRGGAPQDRCLEELFKAIDTAKTLRRSLRGEDTSTHENRRRFIEFLSLEIPCAAPGSAVFGLRDRRTGSARDYTLGEAVYAVRCMMHENENLNAAEDVEHHILLDWSDANPAYFAQVRDGTLICNGFFLWNRLRQVLSKFITGIEGMISFARDGSFSITISPDVGSIRPSRPVRTP